MKTVKIAAWILLGCLMSLGASCSLSRSSTDWIKDAQNRENIVSVSAQDSQLDDKTECQQTASRDTTYDARTVDGASDRTDQASFIAQIRYQNLPQWVRQSFLNQKLNDQYVIAFRDIRPLYLRGDFNGDRQPDIALMLQKKARNPSDSSAAMAIFHGGMQEVKVIAGRNVLGADDIWQVISSQEVSNIRSTHSRTAAFGKGEGILMAKAASSSRLIYWDGSQYRSTQTSD